MSQVEQADQEFCEHILTKEVEVLTSSLVILCEGTRKAFKKSKSPGTRKLDNYPDASFWKNTLPVGWKKKRPYFINCGSRSDVIRIYSKLIELNDKLKNSKTDSYLSDNNKLFILIDLDLNGDNLERMCKIYQKDKGREYRNTEELYHDIYENHPINTKIIDRSKIIITGWRHKDSYFFEPDLQEYLQQKLPSTKITYNNQILSLEEVYKDMIEAILKDPGIDNNFNCIKERIEKFLSISIPDINSLINECKKINNDSSLTSEEKRKIIEIILKMVDAKKFWEKTISIKADDNTSEKAAKETVIKTIANFYANSCDLSDKINLNVYHIPQWVNFLYSIHSNTF